MKSSKRKTKLHRKKRKAENKHAITAGKKIECFREGAEKPPRQNRARA